LTDGRLEFSGSVERFSVSGGVVQMVSKVAVRPGLLDGLAALSAAEVLRFTLQDPQVRLPLDATQERIEEPEEQEPADARASAGDTRAEPAGDGEVADGLPQEAASITIGEWEATESEWFDVLGARKGASAFMSWSGWKGRVKKAEGDVDDGERWPRLDRINAREAVQRLSQCAVEWGPLGPQTNRPAKVDETPAAGGGGEDGGTGEGRPAEDDGEDADTAAQGDHAGEEGGPWEYERPYGATLLADRSENGGAA
jgi:hypothetical protein